MLSQVSKVTHSGHFWAVVVLLAIGVVFHYPQQILSIDSPSLFQFLGLTRHSVERILFLLPVIYAGLIFGIRGGLACLAVALAIMLPRLFTISLYPRDALLETCGVVAIGILVNVWFEVYRRERARREQALSKLEAAQRELQLHIQVIKSNEERLSALNEVSAAISQSLELEEILNVAIDKVKEVMNVEVALVFLVNEERQELEVKTYRGVSEEFATGVDKLKLGEGFNGQVAQTGEPLLVEDASHDPRLTREVVRKEGIQAVLIAPMKAKGRVVGTLCTATRGSRQFLPEDIELLSHVANHIGVAVDNSRLYQKERLMTEQISKDAVLEKQMKDNLRFYLQQVTQAQEEERRRIARELHDDTTQDLVVLSRRLDSLISTGDHMSRRDIVRLDEMRRQIDRISEGVRRFSQDLRPSVLDDLGLMPALEWLSSDITEHFGITTAMDVIGSVRRFAPETELTLFRIVQEALRNVWKHSEASRAWVTVAFDEDKTVLTIQDNGKGFELPESIEAVVGVGKLGLVGMRERAQLIGGKLTLQSEPDKGTTVTVEVPI